MCISIDAVLTTKIHYMEKQTAMQMHIDSHIIKIVKKTLFI